MIATADRERRDSRDALAPPLIAALLPAATSSAELCDLGQLEGPLWPAERAALGRAVDERRREFLAGRICARQALAGLGLPAAPIPAGESGEPLWPSGLVGSITHTSDYCACALARTAELASIGIDAEPNAPLPDGVLASITSPAERSSLYRLRAESPQVHWDRVLFSAREAVYKAWAPLTERNPQATDALLELSPTLGTFHARLRHSRPLLAGRALSELEGRWQVREGLIMTAVALPAETAERAIAEQA